MGTRGGGGGGKTKARRDLNEGGTRPRLGGI